MFKLKNTLNRKKKRAINPEGKEMEKHHFLRRISPKHAERRLRRGELRPGPSRGALPGAFWGRVRTPQTPHESLPQAAFG